MFPDCVMDNEKTGALLDTNPNLDLDTLTGLDERERALIDTLVQLLRGETLSLTRAGGSSSWVQALAAKFGGGEAAKHFLRLGAAG